MATRVPGVARVARAALVAAVLVWFGSFALSPAPAGAATFPVRLEAGPHTGYTFSGSTVTAHRSMTLSSPATVSGSARATIPGRGVYLHVASGTLAGWWVAENRTQYRPGIVATTAFSPARPVSLGAARYELYRFDSAGGLATAAGIRLTAAATVLVDRTAVVNGLRHNRIASGPWAGWWFPGTITSPLRITCTAGSPPSAATGRIVRSVPAAAGEIALTFDMGGRLAPAMAILRYLELERVCATVFPTGDAASTTIGRQVLAEVRAHPELFELGNHTQHHCNLRDGGGPSACPATRPSSSFVVRELATADATIAALAGRHTEPYWRPPYGAVDSALVAVAAAAGYPYTIMWSVDTVDWRPPADGGPTAAAVAAKVIAYRSAGGIVLMHLGGYPTRDALPAMLAGLRAAGYTPTTVSALFR